MLKRSQWNSIILFFIIPLVGFVADFTSKMWIVANVCMSDDKITLLPFFNIVCTLNTGVSFGMFANMANGANVLLMITTVVLIIIYILMYKEQDLFVKYGYSLAIAGAFGNIIDRFIHKGVIDFLDFHYGRFHYPAFNVADSLVFLGVCLIIGRQFLTKK
jgi:signal peptidase II